MTVSITARNELSIDRICSLPDRKPGISLTRKGRFRLLKTYHIRLSCKLQALKSSSHSCITIIVATSILIFVSFFSRQLSAPLPVIALSKYLKIDKAVVPICSKTGFVFPSFTIPNAVGLNLFLPDTRAFTSIFNISFDIVDKIVLSYF